MKMKQYEVFELVYKADPPKYSFVNVDLNASFTHDGKSTSVKGFYAGNGCYKVRFLPEETGTCIYVVTGTIEDRGEVFCEVASPGRHGPVRSDGTHFRYADGTWFYPFGTTVYAMVHQEDALVSETLDTLSGSSFNKIRLCVFPKHYQYNENEPPCFPFEQAGEGWEVDRPYFPFWDRLEGYIRDLNRLGIECDLILFHSYDSWGFSHLTMSQTKVYLDYVTRRLASFPNLWWSLANEYELMAYMQEDWETIETCVREWDPYHHLLSNHQILRPWDWNRPYTTHICSQTREIDHISMLIKKYGKPMMVDECCYEGTIPEDWGNISGAELVHRFWTVVVQGGYCTHGETFLADDDILWWSKGGVLKGQSPARIGFLRKIVESLPGPLTFAGRDLDQAELLRIQEEMPEAEKGTFGYLMKHLRPDELYVILDQSRELIGSVGDAAFLKYYGHSCPGVGTLKLPEDKRYDIDVLDTWEMTRSNVRSGVSGEATFSLPGKEGIAVLAVCSDDFP